MFAFLSVGILGPQSVSATTPSQLSLGDRLAKEKVGVESHLRSPYSAAGSSQSLLLPIADTQSSRRTLGVSLETLQEVLSKKEAGRFITSLDSSGQARHMAAHGSTVMVAEGDQTDLSSFDAVIPVAGQSQEQIQAKVLLMMALVKAFDPTWEDSVAWIGNTAVTAGGTITRNGLVFSLTQLQDAQAWSLKVNPVASDPAPVVAERKETPPANTLGISLTDLRAYAKVAKLRNFYWYWEDDGRPAGYQFEGGATLLRAIGK
ncbi:MAG: hypothetical protein ACPGOY_18975, partial [Rhodospirillaceae bacterium]